ncbi:auxin-induced protein 10A5 [Trifolium repens]|nr:auxin-induced protein 10A5 [Trifolium repens]
MKLNIAFLLLPIVEGSPMYFPVPRTYWTPRLYTLEYCRRRRFVIPVSYLSRTSFQELLSQTEEQYGYDHPMGGLTIPCREDVFLDITLQLN